LNKVDIKERIKQGLEIREITQTQLATRANIDKGQLSSYISGKYKPRQNNIDALAAALNVSEAWLMGFDVPMERVSNKTEIDQSVSRSVEYVSSYLHIIKERSSLIQRTFSPPSKWKKIFLQLMPGQMLNRHLRVSSMIWIL